MNPDVFTVNDLVMVQTDNILSGLLLGNDVYFVSSPQGNTKPYFIDLKISSKILLSNSHF